MSDPGLADALLRAPIPAAREGSAGAAEDGPKDRSSRRPGGAVEDGPKDRSSRRRRRALSALVTAFVAYHMATLLLHVLPNGGLAGDFFRGADRLLRVNQYMRASSNVQSWSMFAPNPFRANIFVRAYAIDEAGDRWDLGIDIRGRRSYPYVVYDRIAKINRRLAEQTHYIKPVGAWLCREWEREHGGASARRIEFVKLVSDLPRPEVAYHAPPEIALSWTSLGFDPLRLPVTETPMETVECGITTQAQLPPEIRARLGLPPAPAGHYLPLEVETWWTAARQGPPAPDLDEPETEEVGQ